VPVKLWLLLLVCLGCGALFGVAIWRRWSPPIWVALGVGVAARVVAAGLSYRHTPRDVAVYFQHAGQLVLQHQNPMTHLPRFQWNFLPPMPYVFAAEIKTGLPWEIATKVVPIAADLVVIVLLAMLAVAERSRLVALLYALCPLTVLVSAVHGQVEPILLALGLGAFLLVRRERPGLGGLLLGLAIACKTWPVLLGLGLLRDTPVRRWWRVIAGAAILPIAFMLSVPLLLNDSLSNVVRVMSSYRSYAATWGWVGALHSVRLAGSGYEGGDVELFQRIGTVLLALTIIAVVIFFRKVEGVALTAAVLLAFLVVTVGWGSQYMLWPVPFLLLLYRRGGLAYLIAASVYAIYTYVFYIPAIPAVTHSWRGLRVYVVGSLVVIACAVWAMPWRERREAARQSEEPTPTPQPAGQ
jgi:hypothetical protein